MICLWKARMLPKSFSKRFAIFSACLLLSACASTKARIDSALDDAVETASGRIQEVKDRAQKAVDPVLETVENVNNRIKQVQSGAQMLQDGVGKIREGIGQ